MAKVAISRRQKIASKKPKKPSKEPRALRLEDFEGISGPHDPTEFLTNPDNIGRGIMECLSANDPEGVMEIIEMYLDSLNISKMRRDSNIPHSTLYSALKHHNPTIKTLAKIMHAATH